MRLVTIVAAQTAFVVSFRLTGHPLKHQTAPLVLLHVAAVPESAVAVLLDQPLQMKMTLLPSLVVIGGGRN